MKRTTVCDGRVVEGIDRVLFSVPLDELEAGRLRAGLDLIEQTMRPARTDVVTKAIAIMSVRCKRRETSETDSRLAVEVLRQDLAEFPADVAIWVLDEWSRRSPWWPTRAELLALGDSAMLGRRAIHHRLAQALAAREACR